MASNVFTHRPLEIVVTVSGFDTEDDAQRAACGDFDGYAVEFAATTQIDGKWALRMWFTQLQFHKNAIFRIEREMSKNVDDLSC